MKWLQTGPEKLVTRQFSGTRSQHERLDRPLRVAHLTDQHFGPATPHALQVEAVERVNLMQPDLVLLTGDYVAHDLHHLDELQSVVARIQAPTFAVLGNHDHWSGPQEVKRSLERANVEVLTNCWTEIRIAGQRLQLVGVDDAFTGHADVERATRGLARDVVTLGLSHVGDEADELWAHGVSLVLSGHTHSGQLAVGGIEKLLMGRVAGHRYVHGLYGQRACCDDAPEGAVYVSAGIGSSRFGLRIGERARPEIAIFEVGKLPHEVPGDRSTQAPLHDRRFDIKTIQKRHQAALKKQAKRLRDYTKGS